MMDGIVVAGVVWMFLIAAVIFVALCRISNAIEEQKLTRAGVNPENPAHLRLRNVIQSEDHFGIALTVIAFLYTLTFAFLLAHSVLPLR
jgi:hypothetical protein